MFGGSIPCKLKALRSSWVKADPLLNRASFRMDSAWEIRSMLLVVDGTGWLTSCGQVSGPEAARGRLLNLEVSFEDMV